MSMWVLVADLGLGRVHYNKIVVSMLVLVANVGFVRDHYNKAMCVCGYLV